MMVIVGPIGCQYRTWCDTPLWVSRQEDENVELRRGQSQVLALHARRAFDRVDNEIADFDRCCRGDSVNVCWFCRAFPKHSS